MGGRSVTMGERPATMEGQVGRDGREEGGSAPEAVGVGVAFATVAPTRMLHSPTRA